MFALTVFLYSAAFMCVGVGSWFLSKTLYLWLDGDEDE